MASSLKFFAFLFMLSLISTQIHARESHFFSKVRATPTTLPTTTATSTTVNDKDELLNTNNIDQDPSFIPETKNAYGLYGEESRQQPATTQLIGGDPYTTTPTTNIPYKTQETYTSTNNENYYYKPDNNEFSNVNGYEDQTRLQDTAYTTSTTSENQNNNYYNSGNGYNDVERQGMSDTRFMEGGKYYYDASNEKNNYYAEDQYKNTKGYNENTRGGFYSNNNENSFEYNNNMQRSQNVEDFQNEQYDP